MTKLVVEMAQYGNVVFGKVHNTPESLRSNGSNNTTLATEGSYMVKSVDNPQLNDCTLYVGGRYRERDGKCFCYAYPSVEQATKMMGMYAQLIDAINKKLMKDTGYITPSSITMKVFGQ